MIPSRPPSARGIVGLLVGALALLGALAPQASAATQFVSAGSFARIGPFSGAGDGFVSHQHRLAVEHSTGNVLKTDAVGDQIVVYAPNGTGADQIATFGSGSLSDPHGIAIDQTNGDVYVADSGNNRIVRYTTDSQPVPTYTLDATYTSPAQGSGAGEIGSFASALAVDPTSGKLLVADSGNDLVKRFDDTGAYDSFSVDGTGSPSTFTSLQDVAVDSTGDILVVDSDGDPAFGGSGRVERFTAAGAWEATIGPVDGAANVAIRPATDEVVVSGNQDAVNSNDFPTLFVFDSSSSSQATFSDGTVQYSSVSGIAIDDGATGQMFVGTDVGRPWDAGYGLVSVQVFEVPVPAAPTIDAEASATDVTPLAATLNATVDPNYAETTYHFEYGTTAAYGQSTAPASAGSGGEPTPVSAAIEGLDPETTYHVRVVVDNGIGGPVEGADQTFTTEALLPPEVDTPVVSDVTATTATVAGNVNPRYSETTYYFEYGTTTAYGSQTTPQSAGAGNQPVQVGEPLSGLQPGTTYHVRLVADNGVGGPVEGTDQTFTTADQLAPVVEPPLASATAVGIDTATLNATINPGYSETTYHFEYGPTTAYGSQTAPQSAGAGNQPVPVTEVLSGLDRSTTYHFRIVADNEVGPPVAGSDRTFTTPDLPPVVEAGAATDVAVRAATVNGTVDTLGVTAKARFYLSQVGGPHSQTSAPIDLAASEGPQSISASFDDLPAGGTFRVRVSATTNGSGAAATSAPVEFSTQPLPPYVPTPPVPNDPTPYGCDDPKLTGYEGTARPGGQVTLTGSDLGVWGKVTIGGADAEVVDYGSSRITVVVPGDAAGKPAVTVDCAKATNAIALTIAKPPSNRVGTKVGANGALTLRVPGKGRLTIRGAGVRSVARNVKGKSTAKVKLKLTKAGRKALAKSKGGKLTRRVRISFRPTGGSGRTVTRAVTFKKG